MASTGNLAHGVKSIQQMRVPARQTTNNSRLRSKIESTHDYFLEEVDPLIGDCISYLLLAVPVDVPATMLSYFENRKMNLQERELTLDPGNRRPQKEQKIYLATVIGPIIAKLVNRIAFARPRSVVDFLCTELSQMVADEVSYDAAFGSNGRPDMPPATAAADKSNPFATALPTRPESAPTSVQKPLSPRAPIANSSSCGVLPVAPVVAEPRVMQMAVLGAGGAGKTSILNLLQGNASKKVSPTIGFCPVNMMLGEELTVRFYDLGGGERIRSNWDQYYHDVHAVMYVLDAACAESNMQSSIELFRSTLAHSCLADKPVLVMANKMDVVGALSPEGVSHMLDIPASWRSKVIGCSAALLADGSDPPMTDVESGLEWLIAEVNTQYDQLHDRVVRDTQAKVAQDAAKRVEKERKVLRNKIACAFPSLVHASMLPPGALPTPDDVFSEEDGVAFLAGEVGIDPADLPAEAKAVALGIGYQRLALQMVGALRVPVSKKKAALSWEAILEIVKQLRAELGLP